MSKTQVKNQILASKLNNLRTTIYEASLREALFHFFNKLYKRLDKAIKEYWNDDFMFQGQIELILATIHESQREYYNILLRHNLKEYRKARKQGKRLVKLAQTKAKQHNIADKAETTNITKLIKPIFNNQKELFQTSNYSLNQLETQTFKASEITMNRIDQEINTILAEGYKRGKGINHVRDQIHKRFNQLKTWESERIARTEIHDAQTMGVMQSYNEMNVEYVEWDSAHDARVRTAKDGVVPGHDELSGEIIPLGATFSNGLTRPGDRNGPIKQWINCRCGLLPFIIPDGYIAPPGKIPFREEDLIKVETPNYEEVTQHATTEANQKQTEQLTSKVHERTKEWDIYRLPKAERENYLKIKKNHDILKEAIETKNYTRLDELEPSVATAIESKQTVKELGEDFLDFAKEELDDYASDIKRYEQIIKDKNIKVDITPKGVKWKNEEIKDMYHHTKDDTYIHFNQDEKFIKYTFKKEGITIYESVDMPDSKVLHIYEHYKKLPKPLQTKPKLILSAQKPVKMGLIGPSEKLGGYTVPNSDRVYVFLKDMQKTKDSIVHELAHTIEKDLDYYVSNSKEYIEAFTKDLNTLLDEGKSVNDSYVSGYAREFTTKTLNPSTEHHTLYGHRPYSEDFAESVKEYLRNKKEFTENFPNKAKVIKKVLKGDLKPENTTNFKEWVKKEESRYKLTSKELKRTIELEEKESLGTLTNKERKELSYYTAKSEFSYLHKQKVNLKGLNSAEQKRYDELYSKLKDDLKIPTRTINEKEIIEAKLPLTSEEQAHYLELKAKVYAGKKLGFLERTPYKKYKRQIEFNKFYAKYGANEPADFDEYNAYKEVIDNDILKKLGLKNTEEFFHGPKNPVKKPIKTRPKPKIHETTYKGKTYKDYTEVREQIEGRMEELQSKIKYTEDHKKATRAYGQELYKPINNYLWGNTSVITKEVENTIKELDEVIEISSGLQEDTILWKGGTSRNLNLEKGEENIWEAYSSSSYDKDVATDYYEDAKEKIVNEKRKDKPILFKIHAKKGTKGVFMDSNLQGTSGESEFLLKRGQKFRVIDTYTKNGTNICEIELI